MRDRGAEQNDKKRGPKKTTMTANKQGVTKNLVTEKQGNMLIKTHIYYFNEGGVTKRDKRLVTELDSVVTNKQKPLKGVLLSQSPDLVRSHQEATT